MLQYRFHILRRHLTALLTTVLFATAAPLCIAQDNNAQAIDKQQAVKKAQERVKGRVLKVDQDSSRYRVKMLQKSGRVVSVDVDKRSGKVSSDNKKKDK